MSPPSSKSLRELDSSGYRRPQAERKVQVAEPGAKAAKPPSSKPKEKGKLIPTIDSLIDGFRCITFEQKENLKKLLSQPSRVKAQHFIKIDPANVERIFHEVDSCLLQQFPKLQFPAVKPRPNAIPRPRQLAKTRLPMDVEEEVFHIMEDWEAEFVVTDLSFFMNRLYLSYSPPVGDAFVEALLHSPEIPMEVRLGFKDIVLGNWEKWQASKARFEKEVGKKKQKRS